MEPTFIKIKFIPLIRHLQKDTTKCCLEIVPDISCIENIDKIKWNERNEAIEYSVPVTYTIVIKNDEDRNQDKVYYSCIELRHLSSKSMLCCGDVGLTKLFSDNFILTKHTDNCDLHTTSKEYQSDNRDLNKLSYNERDTPKNNKYFSLNNNITKKASINESKMCSPPEAIEKGVQLQKRNRCKQNNMKTAINDEYIDAIEKRNERIYTGSTMSKETITNIPEIRLERDKTRILTITSTCTLNTIDVSASLKVNNNLEKRSEKFTTHELDDITKTKPYFPMNRLLCAKYNGSKFLSLKSTTCERILPHARVAHFMMTVENEILPLKIMLTEIYSKCASLGLLLRSSVFGTSPSQIIINKKDNQKKCNRVVYSIVFEE